MVLEVPSSKNIKLSKSTDPPKYSTIPNPKLCLSSAADPAGTPSEIINKAVGAFLASVSKDSQNHYMTAVNHLRKAELEMGKKF